MVNSQKIQRWIGKAPTVLVVVVVVVVLVVDGDGASRSFSWTVIGARQSVEARSEWMSGWSLMREGACAQT